MRRHGWAAKVDEDSTRTLGSAGKLQVGGAAGRTRGGDSHRTHERDGKSSGVPGKKHATMVFLDWDDTLLPTTHLKVSGAIDRTGTFLAAPPPALAAEICALQDEVAKLLNAVADQADKCSIVTSASEGWVANSAQAFFGDGEVMRVIRERNIAIRHARVDSGLSGRINPARWKADAMWEELEPLWEEHRAVRILSVGDSVWERTAAGVVAREHDILVTIKLKSNPTAAALRKQLLRVRQALPSLVGCTQSAEINAVNQERGKRSTKRDAQNPRTSTTRPRPIDNFGGPPSTGAPLTRLRSSGDGVSAGGAISAGVRTTA